MKFSNNKNQISKSMKKNLAIIVFAMPVMFGMQVLGWRQVQLPRTRRSEESYGSMKQNAYCGCGAGCG